MSGRAIANVLVASLVMGCGAAPSEPVASPSAGSAQAGSLPASTGTRASVTASATLPRGPYPETRRENVVDTLFGTRVEDPYRWLEDGTSPEVTAWSRAQDTFARERLAALPERTAFAKRLPELAYTESMTTPEKHGARLFYKRRPARKEKSALYVRDREGGPERVLLDPETWSKDGSLALGAYFPSPDGKKVAYRVAPNNSDEATMHVVDVATGAVATDAIPGAKYGDVAWTPKGDGFYYVRVPEGGSVPVADRPGHQEVRFHRLGDDPSKDVVVFPKTGDPRRFLHVDLDASGRWLVVSVTRGWASADHYVADRRAPALHFVPLVKSEDTWSSVLPAADRLYVLTNEGAPSFRVFKVDPTRLARDAWTEIVAERKDMPLKEMVLAGGHLVLTYLKDVAGHVELHDKDGKLEKVIALPGPGSVGGYASERLVHGSEGEPEAFFVFESFVHPTEIRKLDTRTGATSVFHKVEVPFDLSRVELDSKVVTSKDGAKVRFFVARAKGSPSKPGTTPTILQGYGGFRVAQTSRFAPLLLPWIEKGGAFVLAALRGGDELGEEWHRAGMLDKKQNVFDDLFAVAEELARSGLTSPSHLAIRGRSNGGLLVGAALTQRPELFAAVSCGVPLLDMVRYHQFGSGKTWIGEYGSSETEAGFRTLFAYSPYHHVRPGVAYPATLLLATDSDDRVDPLHGRKLVAALQHASTGGPVLLRVDRNAGHGGADLVGVEVEKAADELAFLWSQTAR